MCRSTELSRQNIKQLIYSLTSLRKVMANLSGLQSTNERQAKKSTHHVQEHRTFPPKYQTADVLTDLFEEGDGHLGAVVGGVLQQQSEDFQGQHLMGHL
jgi:hypothetical protein